jgi:hypothetical protein
MPHLNITLLRIPLPGLATIVFVTAACGSGNNTPAAPSSSVHAEVSDPVADGVVSAGVANPPDLVHGTADVAGGNLTFTIQFGSGTLDRASTRLTIELDTDQNPATGNVGAGPIGIDYAVDMWAARTPPTLIQQATPTTCATGGACYVTVGTTSLNVGGDTLTATVPLATIANASGRLNYRVLAYASPQSTTPTVTADVMPDINLPPAHVP